MKRGNGSGSVYRRKAGGFWYAAWYDFDGRRRVRCTGTTDKQKSMRILAEFVGEAALRAAGVIDVRLEAIAIQSRLPIRKHIDAYSAKMTAARKSYRHIATTIALIQEIVDAGSFQTAQDIALDPINLHLADLADADVSNRTIAARVVAFKGFVGWLVNTGKLALNPLATLRSPKIEGNRKLRRRMLLPSEWPLLYSATLRGGPWRGISPIDRALLYATAIQTGLRQGELRSLTKGDLKLAGDQPHIVCKGEHTKNSEAAKQYVQAGLAEDLRQHIRSKAPQAPVFNMPSEYDVADMLRSDLAAARNSWLDEVRHDPEARAKRQESSFLATSNDEGQELDFHALRHTCGAWLAIQGVYPKTIQTVMRHSTIKLTMDTYGHLLPDQHANAIAAIEPMFQSPIQSAVSGMLATQIATVVRNGASVCEQSNLGNEKASPGQVLQFQGKHAESEEKTGENEIASCRARTYDPLIKSQRDCLQIQDVVSRDSDSDSHAANLAILRKILATYDESSPSAEAMRWAIDQLTST